MPETNQNSQSQAETNEYPLYINRERSLLEFNRRVLAQASNEDIPLLERLKYLCISSSNMDEFFEVRLASLMELMDEPGALTMPDEQNPAEVVNCLSEAAHEIVEEQYHTLNNVLIPSITERKHPFHQA